MSSDCFVTYVAGLNRSGRPEGLHYVRENTLAFLPRRLSVDDDADDDLDDGGQPEADVELRAVEHQHCVTLRYC
jgi:hypothetical protein